MTGMTRVIYLLVAIAFILFVLLTPFWLALAAALIGAVALIIVQIRRHGRTGEGKDE